MLENQMEKQTDHDMETTTCVHIYIYAQTHTHEIPFCLVNT